MEHMVDKINQVEKQLQEVRGLFKEQGKTLDTTLEVYDFQEKRPTAKDKRVRKGEQGILLW